MDSKTIRQLIGTAIVFRVLTIFLIGALFLLVSPKPLLSRWGVARTGQLNLEKNYSRFEKVVRKK